LDRGRVADRKYRTVSWGSPNYLRLSITIQFDRTPMTEESLSSIVTAIRKFQDRSNVKDELQLHRASVLETQGPLFFSDVSESLQECIKKVNERLNSTALTVDNRISNSLYFTLNHHFTCVVSLQLHRRRITFFKSITGDEPDAHIVDTRKIFGLSVTRNDSICAIETDTRKQFSTPESLSDYIMISAFEGLPI
jgi:hypothetical protein